jgi:hypothetical protein
MISGKGILFVQERELRQPPSPCRVYRPDAEGQLVLVDPDFRPSPSKLKSGRARYRDSMIRGSSRGWFDSPESDH